MGDVPSLPLKHLIPGNYLPDVTSNEYMKYYPPPQTSTMQSTTTTTLPPTLSTPDVRLADNQNTYSIYPPFQIHPQSSLQYYPYGFPGVMYSTVPNSPAQYFLPYQVALPPNTMYSTFQHQQQQPSSQSQQSSPTHSNNPSTSGSFSTTTTTASLSSSATTSAQTSTSGSNQVPMPLPMLVQMPMHLPIPLPPMSPLPPPEENKLSRINSNNSNSSASTSPHKQMSRGSSHHERRHSSNNNTNHSNNNNYNNNTNNNSNKQNNSNNSIEHNHHHHHNNHYQHNNNTNTKNNIINSSNHAQPRSTHTLNEEHPQKPSHKTNQSKSSFKYQKEFEFGLNRDMVSSSLVVGRVFSMSQDQAGCKILQKIVKRGSQEDLETMYQEVNGVLGTILKDVFGNYFFQCLYEQANSELKHKIVGSVLCDIFDGAKNCYGTRSIQCLIKNSSEDIDLFTKLKSQLIPNLYQLCTDRYGNHCIKQLMMSGTYEMNIDIVEFLKSHWYEFCIHQYCNSVVQTCLRTYPLHILDFCELIISEVLALIQSEYGNYVIQCLVKNFPDFKETICRLVISYLVPLSRDKYSSMVLQDCVRFASEEIQIEYVREIISSGSLVQLSLHKYSNFVIQEALSVLPLHLKSQLVNVLQPHKATLSKSPFGATIVKHLV